jgi:hypothetical protein
MKGFHMKIIILSTALWFGIVTATAFSQEAKTIDIKEMVKVAQLLNKNASFVNDPEAMRALKGLVANLETSPEIRALMRNPEGLAAMIRILNKFEEAHAIKVE